jgi:hypothetical protein
MSVGVGAWIVQIVFWSVLAWGLFSEALGKRMALLFAALWLAGNLVLSSFSSDTLFMSYVASLDIALVLIVVKGDVRLS